jgi:hypothetical protein
MIKLKRAYEKPASDDGDRILVERLWPRGLTKLQAQIDLLLTDGQLQHYHQLLLTKRRSKNFIQKQAARNCDIERIHAFFHWDANDFSA